MAIGSGGSDTKTHRLQNPGYNRLQLSLTDIQKYYEFEHARLQSLRIPINPDDANQIAITNNTFVHLPQKKEKKTATQF